MPEAGVLPGTVATAGAGAEAGDKSIPSVHAVWQMWQDGKISKEQFVEALGGDLPDPVVRVLNQLDCTYSQFVKSYGQQNSFASKSAGNRTQYRDNVRSLISDNSAPIPSTTFEHASTNFKRVRSDISRQAEKEPNFRVRKANDVSRNNPLSAEATAVTENAGSGTAAAEEEANLHSAIRMFLDGELKTTELGEYVCSLREKGYNPRAPEGGLARSMHTLLERHEVNGPFGFRYLAQCIRDILLKEGGTSVAT
mmetsp:Transcript_27737/g.69973  ORF Transcript_27737/g.69973 Transcript_27737/m.69973 type:complete len:253 (+) Transcript_27737:97-855(+)|eukprot:g10886.t1